MVMYKQLAEDWQAQLEQYSSLVNRISKLLFQYVRQNPSESNKQMFRDWYAWGQRYREFAIQLLDEDMPVLSAEKTAMLETFRMDLAKYSKKFDALGVFGQEEITVPEQTITPKDEKTSFGSLLRMGIWVAGAFAVAAGISAVAETIRQVRGSDDRKEP